MYPPPTSSPIPEQSIKINSYLPWCLDLFLMTLLGSKWDMIRHLFKNSSNNSILGFCKNPSLISSHTVKGPTVSNFKALTSKMTSGMPKMCKSHFGQLCAYLMSPDTHHRTCPRYSHKECSSQVSKNFYKYFSSYRADKPLWLQARIYN